MTKNANFRGSPTYTYRGVGRKRTLVAVNGPTPAPSTATIQGIEAEIMDVISEFSFTIERNDGAYETRDDGRWLVTEEIGGECELWDSDFTTKHEALTAVRNRMAEGEYRKTQYDWAYFIKEN